MNTLPALSTDTDNVYIYNTFVENVIKNLFIIRYWDCKETLYALVNNLFLFWVYNADNQK